LEQTREEFAENGVDMTRVQVEAFLTDMPAQYAVADVVLARSGSTIAELAAAGRPSVLVPLPTAADDHQRKNAEVFVEAGAAVMLLQKDVTPESLFGALNALLTNAPQRAEMAEKAHALAKPGALDKITAMVLRVAKK
jgi:UDP-N-acetylglucosamine--N-acetylmuramyl-(pentapeptide) pyrophosphoryl-undecaprenol N-acetylglucosamine transferase